MRRERAPAPLAAEALSHLLDVGVRLADPEARACFALATRLGLSAYDAAYLALAEALGGELWTGDRRLWEWVQGATGKVRWIGDDPR